VLFQRCGRIIRIGSPYKKVNIICPVTEGTYDERTLGITVVKAGLTGLTAAHSPEDFAKSSNGQIVAALEPVVNTTFLRDKTDNSNLALVRAMVGV